MRVKHSRAARENRMVQGFGPVQQILGVSDSHLGILPLRVSQKIHPVFAIDLFVEDRAGFGPLHIPTALIGGEQDSLPLPMDEILRTSQTQLGIAFVGKMSIYVVVSRIREIERFTNFHDSRILNSSSLFIGSLALKNRLITPREMNSVLTSGVSE